MTGAAALAAEEVADVMFSAVGLLDPLDWIVIVAAAVALIVLVREYRRGPGPLSEEA